MKDRKLTVEQKRLLVEHGIPRDEIGEYRLSKIQQIQDGDPDKPLTKVGSKSTQYTVFNRLTGEEKIITIS